MKYPAYFGTYSTQLFRGEFNDDSGSLSLHDSINIENPSYLVRKGDILYGVSETDKYQGQNGGSVFSVSIKDKGQMNLISIEATNGRHPCHLCIQDEYIFVSNYSEGTLSIFSKDKNGVIKPSNTSISHYGTSIDTKRQKQAHIHFAAMSPDYQYLTVCDLGLDKVFAYNYQTDYGLTTNAEVIDCPPGSGPRHLTFSNSGKTLYVLAELSNFVLVYRTVDSKMNLVQEISTLPDGFAKVNTAAAIHKSPCGEYLAVSNRGHDSIVIYQIKDDETLEVPSYIMTGAVPRDFKYSQSGKWILSANQEEDSVTVYHTNKPDKAVNSIVIPSPVCIAF